MGAGMGDNLRHGGLILVQALKDNGVRRVFSVPGESFLAVLDGLYDSGIQNIVCRQEGGAAMMAEATGKLTGRPGMSACSLPRKSVHGRGREIA